MGLGELIRDVLPLALGAAVSPLLLTATLLTLSSRERPLAKATAVALGAAVPLLALGIVGIVAFSHTVAADGSSSHAERSAWIDLALGALLLLLGVRQLLRRREEGPAQATDPGEGSSSHGLGRSALLGFGMMLTNFTTAILYVAALKLIGRADVGTGDHVVALAVLLVVTLLPVLLPLASYAIAPGPASRILGPFGAWVGRHKGTVGIVFLLGFGSYLLIKGLSGI